MTTLILRHSSDNSLGHLVEVLERRNLPYLYWNVHEMAFGDFVLPDNTSMLVVLGGMMNVDQTRKYDFLLPERAFIRQCFLDGMPIFGICLGAQLLARSLEAPVTKNPTKEVGWTPIQLTTEGYSDPVLSRLGDGIAQFQWHEDTFALPHGASHLAWNADCQNQAFRLTPYVYGVQFHPEVDFDTIRGWLNSSKSLSPERADEIWSETLAHFETRKRASQAMFDAFCQQASLAPSVCQAK